MTNSYEREAARLREEATKRESGDLPLFTVPIREMAHRGAPGTSKAAAGSIADQLSHLHRRVLAAFEKHGPMTAKKAERLPEFDDLGFSTVRKRISELSTRGCLRDTCRVEARCKVYAVSLGRTSATPQEAA